MKKFIFILLSVTIQFSLFGQCVDNGNYWNESWVSCTTSTNPNPIHGNTHWILYDFHEPQYITTSHIWNANRTGESGWGMKDVIIDYSVDGTNWIELGQYDFPQGPESSNYDGFVGPDFGGLFIEKILITILSNHDGGNCASIAEMQFNIDQTACYGIIDECGICNGPGATTWYLDADGDGFGDMNTFITSCNQPVTYVTNSSDACDNGNLGWSDVAQLFEINGCSTACHGAGQSGGLDLRSYSAASQGGFVCGTDIFTGTKLVDIITISNYAGCGTAIAFPSMNDRAGGTFDAEELEKLQLWVDGGAPEECSDFCLNLPNEIPYNGLDDDCNPATLDDDFDQDGFISAVDCDDNDPNVHIVLNDIYVDLNATGNNDGSSWEHAFIDLQSALAVGTNHSIHIAEGNYLPTSGTSRGIYFTIPSSTHLLGGYPTGGGERDFKTHLTTLSGDVDGVGGNEFNSFHVVSIVGKSCITLDGIIISGGGANNSASFARARGAGLYINNSNHVQILNCKIEQNTAIYGGGMFAYTSTVDVIDSEFSNNEAEYGSAVYHSNQTELLLNRARITDNNSTVRCAIEVNNSLFTRIENSLIANNASTNANAIGLIATNRDQTFEVFNSTILGETKNKYLITLQVGFGDQLDATFKNSIIAHQTLGFDKAFKDYNNNILNLTTENCYIQGTSVIGTALNNLYSATAGDLLLNPDYSLDECSPAVDAGNDATAVGSFDIMGNPRMLGTVDMGAFESQSSCPGGSARMASVSNETRVFPNPTNGKLTIESNIDGLDVEIYDVLGNFVLKTQERSLDLGKYASGVYIIHLRKNDELISTHRIVKSK